MRITYDSEVDALYIRFLEATVITEHLAEGIAADYDAWGRLVGIEILDAVKRFGGREVFRQVVLEDVALARGVMHLDEFPMMPEVILEAIKKKAQGRKLTTHERWLIAYRPLNNAGAK